MTQIKPFISLIVALAGLAVCAKVQAGGGNALDRLNCRLPAVNAPVTFTRGCDPGRQNYPTIKFRGNDANCQLDFADASGVSAGADASSTVFERAIGPTAIFPDRFYYTTLPINFASTSKKITSLDMGGTSKRMYSAFTHTTPMFVPDSNDPAGTKPAQTGQATLDTPGDAKVFLSWNASACATGYNIKRSTDSGGPYTLLAKVTGTNYSDTTLAVGTNYFYVVAAMNTVGKARTRCQPPRGWYPPPRRSAACRLPAASRS